MIVFDLRCGAGHVFEAWFGSNADWEAQRASGQVACPLCGDAALEKRRWRRPFPPRPTRDAAARPRS
jgi:hypothetical protein